MNQLKADAVRIEDNSTGETAVIDQAIMDQAVNDGILSVDQYAEQLMDDLFIGIEHSLETGEILETVIPNPKPSVTVQTFIAAPAAPLSVVAPLESATPETLSQQLAAETAIAPEANATSPASAPNSDWSLRILWIAAILSCAGALAMCIANWNSYKALFQQVTSQTPSPATIATVPTAAPEAPNQEFANYIQQSLEALASQQPVTNPGLNGSVVAAAPTPVLPTVPQTSPLPGGLAPATQPATILERVYIPVYQTPQGLVPVVPGVPVPNLTANGTFQSGSGVLQTIPVPSPAVQQPGAIAASTAPPRAATAAPAAAATPQPLATSEHTLVGLLELGDSSAALFEVNGVTRRFSLGERIGSSGWTLVDAKNSEAIVRRNGEIRSVFVGQTF